jgi:HAD superfamily phosphatase (TIGR01668 family)
VWRLLEPDETAATIFAVDYGRLFADGKRALLFDLDNTLGAGRPNRLAPRVEKLLRELASTGFRVGILSNRRRRIDPILSNLRGRFPARLRAGKPARRAFHELLEEMGARPGEAVMIGDRRLTDVLGARRAGIHSVLIAKTRSDA